MINIYKEISEEILKILETNNLDNIDLNDKFKKRQNLIDNLSEKELEKFRKDYKKECYELDKVIKDKLTKEIESVKKEIKDFKVNKTANSAYANMNKNNLNIFYKKV